jgi:hypothetical protein
MDETSGVALALKGGGPTYSSRRRPAAPKVRLHSACGVTSFAGGGRKAEFIY